MKRAEAKIETRRKLLEVAEALFVETNFAANTAEIAKRCGIAHGTVFFHFQSREELVSEVVKNLILRISDALYDANKTAKDLEQFLAVHLKVVQAQWPLYRALVIGFSGFSDQVKDDVIGMLSGINFHLVEAFEKWSDEGLVRATFWQSAMVYMSLFGDFLMQNGRISSDFRKKLVNFLAVQGGAS
jgi:AcrR family transcriptional regulator